MVAAAINKFHEFVEEKNHGGHALNTDQLAYAITNTAPTLATDTVLDTVTAHPEPPAIDGYTTGGENIVTASSAQTGGAYKLTLTDDQLVAGPGGIGPFRYVLVFNKSSTPANKLIGHYDYGSSITLTDGETFDVDFDDVNGVFTDT